MPRHMQEQSLPEKYKPYLVRFISFKHGRVYDVNQDFSNIELDSFTPQQLVRYMRLKGYGTPDPPPHANPTEGRAPTLLFIKKIISFFMPNRLVVCNELANPPVGNPTKSVPMNNLIKSVKRQEARKQGKPSQARKPFEAHEYKTLIEILDNLDDKESSCLTSAIYRFQSAIVGRIDECAKVESSNIRRNMFNIVNSVYVHKCAGKKKSTKKEMPQYYWEHPIQSTVFFLAFQHGWNLHYKNMASGFFYSIVKQSNVLYR